MVDSLDQYIHDIYTLEIKQRDAHMRALQSQINPHFLYNTLEYIRMYALSRQQEELADVVYAFQRYLGIILTKKTTTLAEEISFCEKYVYLYQMRYPDQFAYKFEIEETIADVEILSSSFSRSSKIILCMVLTINDKTMLSRSTPTEKAKKLCGCCG